MSKRSKIIIGVIGFLIGYIIISWTMWSMWLVLKYVPLSQDEIKKLNAEKEASTPGKYIMPLYLEYKPEQASFLQALNPFVYTLNPSVFFFTGTEQ